MSALGACCECAMQGQCVVSRLLLSGGCCFGAACAGLVACVLSRSHAHHPSGSAGMHTCLLLLRHVSMCASQGCIKQAATCLCSAVSNTSCHVAQCVTHPAGLQCRYFCGCLSTQQSTATGDVEHVTDMACAFINGHYRSACVHPHWHACLPHTPPSHAQAHASKQGRLLRGPPAMLC